MAGEASSSSTCRYTYDVFLSFRGKDTRKTFTDHLYTAMLQAGIHTFKDDDEIEKGENIQSEVQKAIQQSKISVIVFSKDYASSQWCLDELVMIIERKRTSQHVVLPVFYDVHPSEVRNQSGAFAKVFARYECMKKVKGWRAALGEVADTKGFVLQNEADGHESKFINKIIKGILDRMVPFCVNRHPIVKEFQAREVNLWVQHTQGAVELAEDTESTIVNSIRIPRHRDESDDDWTEILYDDDNDDDEDTHDDDGGTYDDDSDDHEDTYDDDSDELGVHMDRVRV
uniref:TIR domain-containing protein n=1 Tax=Davidia involucrata TaxID=16924 RepID=A0A5B6YU73_DAVIN